MHSSESGSGYEPAEDSDQSDFQEEHVLVRDERDTKKRPRVLSNTEDKYLSLTTTKRVGRSWEKSLKLSRKKAINTLKSFYLHHM